MLDTLPEPDIVLIMHRPMAQAFRQCAEHVLGGHRTMLCFDIDAINDVETEAQLLLETLTELPNERLLLLNDLYGATPYRVAHEVKNHLSALEKQAFLVTGVSVPMVLKALTDHAGEDFEAYVQAIARTSLRAAIIE
ncbi:MAG TPA: PTS sugar transporter subunit IIA [Paenalcaligenes sp.]|nr:PTS sugar transporter subunit IIA [Paenalcaligenes sp.]